jgi:hypothetical protein
MSETKINSLAPNFAGNSSKDRKTSNYESALSDRREKGLVAADGKDVSGWEAYRRWLTRVQAPEKKRAPLDAGLYTWKGYRNWSDKVRRDWSLDEKK